jgi:subtilase family serine protease
MKVKIMGVVVLVVALISIIVVPAALAANNPSPQSGKPDQAQIGHVRPPIYFQQVAAPLRPDKPGKGPGGNTSVVYTPATIQQAYDFGTSANGSGVHIAIVDAYGDPSIVNDAKAFNDKFNILPALELNVNLNIWYPDGTPTSSSSGWAIETALDVEWAHANAPFATIDLVIVPDSSWQHMLDGVNYAIQNLDVAAISMSWGGPEIYMSSGTLSDFETAFSTAANQGILLFGASGDQGAYDGTHPRQLTPDYPASSRYVIGVGGTTLTLNSSGDYLSESAWKGSGGGYSTDFQEPSCQTSASIDTGNRRGVPDIAFDADPSTGVYVYCNGKWYSVGGTSVGAPNWAAISADFYGLTSQALNLTYLYGNVYGNLNKYHDVTSGNNGYYTAGNGWDPVTGIGTPDVSQIIPGS